MKILILLIPLLSIFSCMTGKKDAPVASESMKQVAEIKPEIKIKYVKVPVLTGSMFQRIHFDFDKSSIRSDAAGVIEEIYATLNEYPDFKIRIEGHCDERGSAEYNLAPGERRATSAKMLLVELGIDRERIDTISYGEERPVLNRSTFAAWALLTGAQNLLFIPGLNKIERIRKPEYFLS